MLLKHSILIKYKLLSGVLPDQKQVKNVYENDVLSVKMLLEEYNTYLLYFTLFSNEGTDGKRVPPLLGKLENCALKWI